MKRIFVGGSRHVSRLDALVHERLDRIISNDLPILIGDANGADKAVQLYLRSKKYQNVEVFCTEGSCRNNMGGWRVRTVPATNRRRDAEFYSAKDRAMAKEAAIGLMLWDGKSIGTLMNVQRLVGLQKKAVVYTVPDRQFTEFRTSDQWDVFVSHCDIAIQQKLRQRACLEATGAERGQQSLFERSRY